MERIFAGACMKVSGEIVYIHIYDIGGDIEVTKLEKIMNRLPEYQGLKHERTMPKYISITPSPIFVNLGKRKVKVLEKEFEVTVQTRIYSIGALTVILRFPFSDEFEELIKYSSPFKVIYQGREMDLQRLSGIFAKKIVEDMKESITPYYQAEEKPELYTIFCISSIQNGNSPNEFIENHKNLITCLLREERNLEKISSDEVSEALKYRVSYFNDDAAIIDWGASLILEPSGKYEDYLLTIELANLQLLELRIYDRILDQKIDKAYADLRGLIMNPPLSWRKPAKVVMDIAQIRVEMTELIDNIRNITKFFGDWTLAKIYYSLSEKLHLKDWEGIIMNKLNTLEGLYETASSRNDVYRSTLLETLILVLIALEIAIMLLELFRV
ncbi:MAG: hypothetical protein QXG01_02695 [Candidatus Bathyarchaeia archaeon]